MDDKTHLDPGPSSLPAGQPEAGWGSNPAFAPLVLARALNRYAQAMAKAEVDTELAESIRIAAASRGLPRV